MLGLKSVMNVSRHAPVKGLSNSLAQVIDNSGAVQAELINVFKCKPSRKKSVGVGYVGELQSRTTTRRSSGAEYRIGDEVKVVVKKARSIAATTPGQQGGLVQKIRRGDMARAVIVRTKKEVQRADGRMIR